MQSRMVKVEFAQGFQRKMRGEHSSQRDLRAVPNNPNCGHKKRHPKVPFLTAQSRDSVAINIGAVT